MLWKGLSLLHPLSHSTNITVTLPKHSSQTPMHPSKPCVQGPILQGKVRDGGAHTQTQTRRAPELGVAARAAAPSQLSASARAQGGRGVRSPALDACCTPAPCTARGTPRGPGLGPAWALIRGGRDMPQAPGYVTHCWAEQTRFEGLFKELEEGRAIPRRLVFSWVVMEGLPQERT